MKGHVRSWNSGILRRSAFLSLMVEENVYVFHQVSPRMLSLTDQRANTFKVGSFLFVEAVIRASIYV